MSIKDIRLIIFDLDGTLVDAYEAIIRSVNFTLSKFGYPLQAPSAIRKAVGWGDRRLLFNFIKEKDIKTALMIYRKHHKTSLKRYSRLLVFTKKILNYLLSRGYRLAVASNRPTKFTNIILEHLNIKKYFDYVLCADKLQQGKPHPEILIKITDALTIDRHKAIYIGDMVVDIEAAHNAGIKSIAVCGGSSTQAEIRKARPFKIIKNLAYLKSYL